MDHSLKYKIHTFGCKVNTYDTGLIQKNLSGKGFFDSESEARIHVLNTCAVTQNATKDAVKYIRKIKIKDPFSTIVVTGCGAQVDTGAFDQLPGVDLVVANSHKGLLPDLLKKFYSGELKEKVFKSNIFRKEDLEMGGGTEKSHTRSFLKIQDGCNSFCTYCIIPYARGKSRSIPVKELTRRINELYNDGVREVVLTGVHIGDYEDSTDGKKNGLEDLLEQLTLKTKMPRFRLSSLEPVEVSDRLLDLYSDSRWCPHFHMSIQSANTEVLKNMKRNYSKEDVIFSLEKIYKRIPNVFIGMDVIVGFPTETEEQFQDTYMTLTDLPWNKIHVFPYSERQGTKAAIIEETVPWNDRQRRASRLRELSLNRFEETAKKQLGLIKKVLVLKNPAKGSHGVSEDFWPVFIKDADGYLEHWAGQEINVKINEYKHEDRRQMEGFLVGEVYE